MKLSINQITQNLCVHCETGPKSNLVLSSLVYSMLAKEIAHN
jgi:hypothetical protein